jgi:hypothetical protein
MALSHIRLAVAHLSNLHIAFSATVKKFAVQVSPAPFPVLPINLPIRWGPLRRVELNIGFGAAAVQGSRADVGSWQCALKARIISGGGFHPDNCR